MKITDFVALLAGIRLRRGILGVVVVMFFAIAWAESAAATAKETVPASPDSAMMLMGGQDGTEFKDLVVEGEDQIRIEFERPALDIDIDPQSAPGLEWGSIQDVLDRQKPDSVSPFLQVSAQQRMPYGARPWLDQFATGDLVRFRPQLEGVDRWRLVIANSRGETVKIIEGKGKLPKEIGWNGRSEEGDPAPPGLTYSYVLEAFDRAGNRRNFVGEGFELPSYRLESSDGQMMIFSGNEIAGTSVSDLQKNSVPSSMLLEVASRINQSRQLDQPVRIEVTARSFDRAKTMVNEIVGTLDPIILRGVSRIQPITHVEPDAPGDGTILVVVPE